MRKFRHIYVELYKKHVYFAKCSRKQYGKMLKDKFSLDAHNVSEYGAGTTEIYTAENKTMKWRVYVIWVNEWQYFSHELFHCAHMILRDAGMYLSDDSQEAYAYLIEYLDNQLRKERIKQ